MTEYKRKSSRSISDWHLPEQLFPPNCDAVSWLLSVWFWLQSMTFSHFLLSIHVPCHPWQTVVWLLCPRCSASTLIKWWWKRNVQLHQVSKQIYSWAFNQSCSSRISSYKMAMWLSLRVTQQPNPGVCTDICSKATTEKKRQQKHINNQWQCVEETVAQSVMCVQRVIKLMSILSLSACSLCDSCCGQHRWTDYLPCESILSPVIAETPVLSLGSKVSQLQDSVTG